MEQHNLHTITHTHCMARHSSHMHSLTRSFSTFTTFQRWRTHTQVENGLALDFPCLLPITDIHAN